jgi:DNA gyrase inhibitor GyrI
MKPLNVRIERLAPMRVASVRALSESPEREAWERLRTWAEPRGLLSDLEHHPVYGFNNPNPTPERKEYGYEFWIQIDQDTGGEGDVEVKDFEGGLYAVTRCELLGEPNVLETWKMLWDWVQGSKYTWRKTHELERPADPRVPEEDLVLDLFLPIET